MDLKLLKLVSDAMPKMNEHITNGIVSGQMQGIEKMVHDAFLCAAEGFPSGLRYCGFVRCTPLEQYKELTRPLKPFRMYDLAVSDVYLIKVKFTFNGIELAPQYIFLPFCREGGLMYLKGVRYQITPVLAGSIFNIEEGAIYMPVYKARLGFKESKISCFVNDQLLNTICVYSHMYNEPAKSRSTLNPTLVHYILAEYGLTKALKLIFNVDVSIGGAELDSKSDTMFIYRSRNLPIQQRLRVTTVPVIRLAIPKNQHYAMLDSVMCTIIYIIDNCVEGTADINQLEDPNLWLSLLDRFIRKAIDNTRKRFEKLTDHLNWVKSILDPISKRVLLNINIPVADTFELFRYICLNFHDMIIHNDAGSMYNKELNTVKYVIYNIIHGIFITMYELETLKKLPPAAITADKVEKILRGALKKEKIYNTRAHGELTYGSIATNCKQYGGTCSVVSHNQAIVVSGSSRSSSTSVDPSILLHPSQIEVCSSNWITKKGPTGRNVLNPFLNFQHGTYTSSMPEMRPYVVNMEELFKK